MADPGSLLVGGPLVLALLCASAFFSSTEIAIFSLPSSEGAAAGDGDDPGAAALAHLMADPHRLLVTLLVGNNLVNVALATVVAIGAASVLPPGEAALAATVLASTLVLVFGEILPKAYGLGHAVGWSRAAARPLLVIQAGLYPVVAVFDAVTRRLARLVGGDQDIEVPYTD